MTSESLNLLIPVVLGVFIVLIMGGLFWAFARQSQQALVEFRKFAATHSDLQGVMKVYKNDRDVFESLFPRKYPAIEGTFDGVAVKAHFSRAPNVGLERSATHTIFEAQPLTPMPPGLLVRPSSVTDVAGHALGQTIQTGDATFDRHFTLRADDAEQARSFLSAARRAAFVDVAGQCRYVAASDTFGVSVYLKGLHTEPEALELGLALATRLARRLS